MLNLQTRNFICITTPEQLKDAVRSVIQTIIDEGGDGDAAILVPNEHMAMTREVIDEFLSGVWLCVSNFGYDGMYAWYRDQEALHLSVDTNEWCSYTELKSKVGTCAYPATFIYEFDFSRGDWV